MTSCHYLIDRDFFILMKKKFLNSKLFNCIFTVTFHFFIATEIICLHFGIGIYSGKNELES
jgi:hypothetical protein